MTSDHHALYILGHKRATMVGTNCRKFVRRSQSEKADPSSDRGLQFVLVKLESLVIANQTCCGEYVLGSCTHRPSNYESC